MQEEGYADGGAASGPASVLAVRLAGADDEAPEGEEMVNAQALVALQAEAEDARRRLQVSCTQMAEFAGVPLSADAATSLCSQPPLQAPRRRRRSR
jgi:hypothetical protein